MVIEIGIKEGGSECQGSARLSICMSVVVDDVVYSVSVESW